MSSRQNLFGKFIPILIGYTSRGSVATRSWCGGIARVSQRVFLRHLFY